MADRPRRRRNRELFSNDPQEIEENNKESSKNKFQKKTELMFEPGRVKENMFSHRDPQQDAQESPSEEQTRSKMFISSSTQSKRAKRRRQRKQADTQQNVESLEINNDEQKEKNEQNEQKEKDQKDEEVQLFSKKYEGQNLAEEIEQLQRDQLQQSKKQTSKSSQEDQGDEVQQQAISESSEDEGQNQKIEGMLNKKISPNVGIKPMSFHLLMGDAVSREDKKKLFQEAIPHGKYAYCYLKRMTNGISDEFIIMGEDQRPLLFCENQRGCIGCNYYISLTKEMDKNSDTFLGKVRGNAVGSSYQLYDSGKIPSKEINRLGWRTSLGQIEYESNFLGMKGPRKFKAIIPLIDSLEDFDFFKLAQAETLVSLKHSSKVRCFRNKQPRWVPQLQSYFLYLGSEVKLSSIKNFVMIDDNCTEQQEESTVLGSQSLVLGKVDQNTFSIKFRHPFSLFQALGVAITSFDFKLNCD